MHLTDHRFSRIAHFPLLAHLQISPTTTSILSYSLTHQRWLTFSCSCYLLPSPPSISLSLPHLPFSLTLSSRKNKCKESASIAPISRERRFINLEEKLDKNKSSCHSVLNIFVFPKCPFQIFHYNFHSLSYFHLVVILGIRSFTTRATENLKS